MLTISKRLTEKRTADLRLVLPFEQRSKSRLRTVLDNAEEAGLFLERGSILRGGDLLQADDGRVVEIVAAPETVSKATSADPQTLLRASYHLGNRHVALQIGPGWLRYQHDHVLDEMVQGLGLSVRVEQASFEPEAGAYGAGSHSHEHDHQSSEASVAHHHHHRHD